MANPNIVNVTSIYGKVVGAAVTATETALVSNPASSGKIYKINSLIVSNIDGALAADITVRLFKNQAVSYALVSTVSVPADSTLIVLDKTTSIYLEENDSIRIQGAAGVANDLQAICSYEEIS